MRRKKCFLARLSRPGARFINRLPAGNGEMYSQTPDMTFISIRFGTFHRSPLSAGKRLMNLSPGGDMPCIGHLSVPLEYDIMYPCPVALRIKKSDSYSSVRLVNKDEEAWSTYAGFIPQSPIDARL